MADSLIDGVYDFQIIFPQWQKKNQGKQITSSFYIHLASVVMVGWEPVPYITLTPLEHIQSATVKSNQSVNTGQTLCIADYHILSHLIDSWLIDLNTFIWIHHPVRHLFHPSCQLRFVDFKYLWNLSSLFMLKKCTATEHSAHSVIIICPKFTVHQTGTQLQLFTERVLISQTNYMCLCPHFVSVSARQHLTRCYWLC